MRGVGATLVVGTVELKDFFGKEINSCGVVTEFRSKRVELPVAEEILHFLYSHDLTGVGGSFECHVQGGNFYH